jgi:phage-related protein
MPVKEPEWVIEFYVDELGNCPPMDFINSHDANNRAKIETHLRLLRTLGVRICSPHARKIKGHEPLWELRPMPMRLIYFAHTGRRFIILHAFTKKLESQRIDTWNFWRERSDQEYYAGGMGSRTNERSRISLRA